MQHKPFLIEEKMDGERIQLHKKGNEYKYISRWVECPCFGSLADQPAFSCRKGHDYSEFPSSWQQHIIPTPFSGYLYGEHVGAGTLTPYIHNSFSPNVKE
jgi:DNA ligase-4